MYCFIDRKYQEVHECLKLKMNNELKRELKSHNKFENRREFIEANYIQCDIILLYL